jgi:threonine aldolase
MSPVPTTKPAIDLRSDTITKPSAAMRQAMAEAEVGDDVYAEDPTVNALEAKVAALFGHDAGLFCPTGSLANQLGMRMLVKPGEELACDSMAHVARAELGAAAAFSGITFRTWSSPRGLLNADQVLNFMTPDSGPHLVSTTAIAVENTHNFGGGTIQPISEIKKLHDALQGSTVAMHLDGARLWNAHIATGTSLKEFGSYFKTVSVCLSKGLGAPIGSVLLSTHEIIKDARIWRKRYGGGMRQVGVLAAAGIYALDHNLDRMKDDHRRAKAIADTVNKVAPQVISANLVDTNIMVFDLSQHRLNASEFTTQASAAGIRIGALGPNMARAITHLDVDDAQCEEAGTALARLLA